MGILNTVHVSAPSFVTDSLRNLSPREVIDHDQQRSMQMLLNHCQTNKKG